MIWLLDSVTIIYALNGQGGCRQRLNSAPTGGRVATSVLAVAEVLYGVESSRRREGNLQRVERELDLLDIYPVTAETARTTQEFGRRLNGPVVTAELRKRDPSLRVLYVSGVRFLVGAGRRCSLR